MIIVERKDMGNCFTLYITCITELTTQISDFGFAISTVKNRLLETFCGSYAYCCPQILRGEPYDGKKADVWSMGVVLYAMACARLPFSDDDMKALSKNEYQGKVKFSKRVSKGMVLISNVY